MRHLSKFLVGARHERRFKVMNTSGFLVDEIINLYGDVFKKIEMRQGNSDFTLRDEGDITNVRCNQDDILVEQKKVYVPKENKYIEIDEQKVIDIAKDCIDIAKGAMQLKRDFKRLGMVFEFRLPRAGITGEPRFGSFIRESFVAFEPTGVSTESSLRFVYKLEVPGAGAVKGMKDFRNVIIEIEEGEGVLENGDVDVCLLIKIDIQRIYDPAVKDVNLEEHFKFCVEHIKNDLFAKFKGKKVDISW